MKFYQPLAYILLTIATTVGAQSTVLSETNFKIPTHPRLFEVGESGNDPVLSGSQTNLECFRVPTHPVLSEVSQCYKQTEVVKVAQVNQQAVPSQVLLGQNFFSHPPMLMRTNATHQSANMPSAYEFTVAVPADAGAPLKAVMIMQATNLETVRFNPNQSKAFVGERYASGSEIPLTNIGGPETPGAITIVFDQPVQPGNTVTVTVDTNANPNLGGVYEFGVTAYPTSQDGRAQFLGYGRINFNGAGN